VVLVSVNKNCTLYVVPTVRPVKLTLIGPSPLDITDAYAWRSAVARFCAFVVEPKFGEDHALMLRGELTLIEDVGSP
jgi:hypothetical protein